jgi:hypothetical protein
MSALKNAVAVWFETGDFPTEAQFLTFFNSIRWNDEMIPVSSVTGLVDILNTLPRPKIVAQLSAAGVVAIPVTTEVYKITFKSNVLTQTISYGVTTSADDIEPGIEVLQGITARAEQTFEVTGGGQIHFAGITGLTTITIFQD